MHPKWGAVIGAVVTISLFVLTNAKRAADTVSIIHLPHDLGEFLTAMSGTPALVSYGALSIGIICLAYLIASSWKPGKQEQPKEIAEPAESEAVKVHVDADSVRLAGVAHAVMERAGSYNFKLPLPDGDPYLKHHDEIKNSTHPIWTNKAINQLRRDFLQRTYIIGSRDEVGYSLPELREIRAELHDFGGRLIGELKGAPQDAAPAISEVVAWKRPLDAIETFADKALIAIKNEWDKKFSDTHEERHQSENAIFVLSNSTDPEKDKKLEHQQRRKSVAVMGHKFAAEELQRAWTDLRADIGKRLEAGELVAKGIPAPYAAGKDEIEISAHEWRLLEISPTEKAEAIERGGGGAKYVGVVIGKRV